MKLIGDQPENRETIENQSEINKQRIEKHKGIKRKPRGNQQETDREAIGNPIGNEEEANNCSK